MLCHNSGTVLRGQPGRRSSEDGSELCLHAPIQARHSLPGPTRGRHTTFRGLLADTRVQVCPHRLTPTRWLGGGMTPLVGDIRCTPLRVEAAVVPLLQGGAVWLEGAGWPLSCTWGPESHRRERQARGCPVWTQLSVCGQPPQRPSPPVPLQTAPRFFGGPPPHTAPLLYVQAEHRFGQSRGVVVVVYGAENAGAGSAGPAHPCSARGPWSVLPDSHPWRA